MKVDLPEAGDARAKKSTSDFSVEANVATLRYAVAKRLDSKVQG